MDELVKLKAGVDLDINLERSRAKDAVSWWRSSNFVYIPAQLHTSNQSLENALINFNPF